MSSKPTSHYTHPCTPQVISWFPGCNLRGVQEELLNPFTLTFLPRCPVVTPAAEAVSCEILVLLAVAAVSVCDHH